MPPDTSSSVGGGISSLLAAPAQSTQLNAINVKTVEVRIFFPFLDKFVGKSTKPMVVIFNHVVGKLVLAANMTAMDGKTAHSPFSRSR